MMTRYWILSCMLILALVAFGTAVGCRNAMPHAMTWPGGGDITQSHAKPPEGGYYTNWDPFSKQLVVTPESAINPVRTQHVLIATVLDEDGEPLPSRRVEWIISEGSIGDIIEVDESGWRNSRGYKVDNHYAVSHTNYGDHVLDRGNDDPSDDIHLETGQTWCVISSPVEGDTHVTVYAPGIYDWSKHKVFVTKHWYDIAWEWPAAATNPLGTEHEFATSVFKHSDGSPLAGYEVHYKIIDGPAAVFGPGGEQTKVVESGADGVAVATLRQVEPAEGVNNIEIRIIRPADLQCCKPAAEIATGMTSKTWVGPRIAITKDAPATALVGQQFTYTIVVSNPGQVTAEEVVVTDNVPEGIEYVSSSPAAEVNRGTLTWELGTLAPQAAKSLQVQVRGTDVGTFENCAEVTAAFDLSARDCAPTTLTAPALKIEKRGPDQVLLCDEIVYEIVVTNTGDGPATNVTLREDLPSGLRTVNGSDAVGGNIGTLAPGQSRTFSFRAKASEVGTYKNTITATADGGLEAEDSVTTNVVRPVLEVSKSGPEMRYVGRPLTYEITVRNTGDAPARDTMLVDEVPAGVEFVSASSGGQFNDGRVIWQLGTLPPDGEARVTLEITPLERGTIRNVAMATAYCAESRGTAATEVRGIPAVLLECIDLEDPDEVGTTMTYVITVTNQGSADATNVQVVCTVQPEAEYVSSDGPTAATTDGQTVTFAPLGTLAPKAKAIYRVIVRSTDEGDTRFGVAMTTDQTTGPVEETESTRFYR